MFKKEKIILQIIDQVHSSTTKRESAFINSVRGSYVKGQMIKNKRVTEINHRISDTYFTKEYINSLTDLIGTSDEFKRSLYYTKKLIQSEIDELSHDDYNLKTYLHKSINETNKLSVLFPDAYENFKIGVSKLTKDSKTSQRSYTYTLPFKLREFYKEIITLLIKENYDLGFLPEMTLRDAEFIYSEYFTSNIMFDSICVVLLKHARDSLFTDATNTFDEKSMSVTKHEVVYYVYRYFTILTITFSIQYMVKRSKRVVPIETLLRSVRTFLLFHNTTISAISSYRLFIDGIESVFNIFAHSGIFEHITKKGRGEKSSTKYYFPTILTNQLAKYTVPPRVFKPNKVTESNLSDYIISSSSSSTTITSVKGVIDSLNISNRKKFTINSNFRGILYLLEDYPELDIKRPIPSEVDISSLKNEKNLYNVRIDKYKSACIDFIQQEITKNNLYFTSTFQYRHMVDVTTSESMAITEKDRLEELLTDQIIIRKGGLTRLRLSEAYDGIPMYYTNQLCSTTRPFVREYLLSRHIGCLKLLRCEFNKTPPTIGGIINMMRAYYCEDTNLLEKFENFLKDYSNRRFNSSILRKFYEENRIEYSTKDAVTHFMLISVELKQVFRTGKTSLLLQIDQVASGFCFLAILFRNYRLAIHTNVHYVPNTENPYQLAMKNFGEFYHTNDKITVKNDKVLYLCENLRKLHKYAMMCYSYNQSNYGRTNDFVDWWRKEYHSSPTNEEWKALSQVSVEYPNFIDTLFPGLNTQIEMIKEIVAFVVLDTGSLRIRSLDGGIIEWKFYKQKSDKRNSFNPHTLTPEKYDIKHIKFKDGKPVVDTQQFKDKFLSYLVHSFDAGIMRKIVCLMYEKHGYRIDQLFDCVLLHPKWVDAFYDILEEIYSDDSLSTYMDTNVFDVWRSSISSDKYEKFDEMVAEFKKIRDKECVVKKFKANVRKMYTPEV